MGFLHPKTWLGKFFLILAFLFLVVLSAFTFYIIDLMGKVSQEAKSGAEQKIDISRLFKGEKNEISTADNYWTGPADPKITIIEFGDFACSYCRNSFSNLREISARHGDRIKVVFKDYPLHDESEMLAMAGRCAGEQGLFWPMHDKLFINQGDMDGSGVALVANQLGADTAKFDACMNANKYLSAIQKDYGEGQALGITGTPTWFINGYRINGDIPRDTFFALVDALVK